MKASGLYEARRDLPFTWRNNVTIGELQSKDESFLDHR
jgi:hypothetical protein